MPRYLISFDDGSMDHIPQQDMPAVGEAAHGGVGTAPAIRFTVPLFKPDERVCRIRLSHEDSSAELSQANEASCART